MKGADRLDAELARFPQLDLARRIDVLDLVIDQVYGEEAVRSAPSATVPALPASLRRLHERACARPELRGNQNFFRPTADLRPDEDGHVTFYVENQAVYLWSFKRSDGADPRIYGKFNEDEEPWTDEHIVMSEFVVEAVILEGALAMAPFGASASWVGEDVVSRIAAHVLPLPLPPWRWPAFPSRFFGSNGVLAVAAPNGALDGELGYSVWIGGRSHESLGPLRDIVDERWEHDDL